MSSPIEVLWGNIVHSFENIDPSLLQKHMDAVDSGLVNSDIVYDNIKQKVITPKADLKTRKIYIQETYLEHLWSYIYSMFVLYEEGVQKPLINNTFKGELEFNSQITIRAKKLYDWSVSLSTSHTPWDETLPNPKTHSNSLEKFYAEKVNSIFQKSVSYALFHEFAHLTHNHDSYFLGLKLADLTDSDIASRIQLENESDQFAFNVVIDTQGTDNEKLVNGLSVLLVNCSALILPSSAHVVKQNLHPDLDDRLLKTLNELGLSSEDSLFYCWYFACFAIRLFLTKHNINLPITEHETAQDEFFSLLEHLDGVKL
ncbi:hypothetical protein HC723_16860 [Vibrio sp. S11_S32]|uniref:phage exclusion protein Lit family protein n=1 Tax=Vibrio sp. S11_S32 TaxID=2720225 RepID=UPI00168066D5|nr:phage exclusion protein Lit family protein [Vibrio sp. S11_S32]MBD1578052.1 hypothetical protein [Vibrio sp. S11_S32]